MATDFSHKGDDQQISLMKQTINDEITKQKERIQNNQQEDAVILGNLREAKTDSDMRCSNCVFFSDGICSVFNAQVDSDDISDAYRAEGNTTPFDFTPPADTLLSAEQLAVYAPSDEQVETEEVENDEQGRVTLDGFRSTNSTRNMKTDTLHGQKHYIVPVVAAVEGVMNGVLILKDYLMHSHHLLNGRPIIIHHPQKDGQDVSANLIDIFKTTIGVVFNAYIDDNKLKAEAWLNESELKRAGEWGRQILKAIRSNQSLEVSLGWYSYTEEIRGFWGKEPYTGVAMNIHYDHLAILPDEIGACSIKDGCGLNVNSNEGAIFMRDTARRPEFIGTTEAEWSRPTFGEYVTAYYRRNDIEMPEDAPTRAQEASQEIKSFVAAHTLLGDAQADNERDLMFFPVVSREGELNANALRAVLSGRGAAADIPADALESAQDMARGLLESEFGVDEMSSNEDEEISLLKRLLNLLQNNKKEHPDMPTETVEQPEAAATAPTAEAEQLFSLMTNMSGQIEELTKQVGEQNSVIATLREDAHAKRIDRLVNNSQCTLSRATLEQLDEAGLVDVESAYPAQQAYTYTLPAGSSPMAFSSSSDDELVPLGKEQA